MPTARATASSNNYQPGDTASLADLPWGRIGLTICYDMRFPSLYRALAESGASFLTMPSAFTKPTGEAHWHVLLRSRAIENGAFVFAAAQGGVHESKRVTYGHSLIVDPWGEILAEGGVDPGVITAEDRSGQGNRRARQDSVAAARPALQRARSERGPICTSCERSDDPLFAPLRGRPRVRELVPGLRPPSISR